MTTPDIFALNVSFRKIFYDQVNKFIFKWFELLQQSTSFFNPKYNHTVDSKITCCECFNNFISRTPKSSYSRGRNKGIFIHKKLCTQIPLGICLKKIMRKKKIYSGRAEIF